MPKKPTRKKIAPKTEAVVLMRSARRCLLCYHLNGNVAEQMGQVAHLNGDRSDAAEDNLAWMCMQHHSMFDSKTSQHKNYTIAELKAARAKLHAAIESGSHLSPGKESPVPGRETDVRTLAEITSLMSKTGSIDWLRTANFAGWSFDWQRLEGIERILMRKDPVHEFVDARLEELRLRFKRACEDLIQLLATSTFPVGHGDRQSIPAEWEADQPRRFAETVKAVHNAADGVCRSYDNLVRTARRMLLP